MREKWVFRKIQQQIEDIRNNHGFLQTNENLYNCWVRNGAKVSKSCRSFPALSAGNIFFSLFTCKNRRQYSGERVHMKRGAPSRNCTRRAAQLVVCSCVSVLELHAIPLIARERMQRCLPARSARIDWSCGR